MCKIYSRVLMGALVGGGLAVLGCGVANAAETSGTDGLLSGDQGLISATVPVTVGGNAVSLIGGSHSEDATTTAPASAPAPSVTTDGSDGILSGNQGLVSVDVPVTSAETPSRSSATAAPRMPPPPAAARPAAARVTCRPTAPTASAAATRPSCRSTSP
ncbi:hypothetical protein [Microbacterium sp. HMWF026]|uniref:hypothetical protein n=1 Tax=Microbacterium sp. HMWF026 TaxID=2056861 RepID=UPI0015E7F629|nr:hypothetical protein [Microbacterium sp. HMWF026]